MKRLFRRLLAWWNRRTVQFRTSAVATVVALIALGVMARISTGFIGWLMLESVDTELRDKAVAVAEQLASGEQPPRLTDTETRVLDTAGDPVDFRAPLSLHRWQLNELKAGEAVLEFRPLSDSWWYRWVGTVTTDPQGRPRLVLVGARLVGFGETLSRAGQALGLGSAGAAALVGVGTWFAVRRSLRPVDRMRVAAASLPEGERLPVPEARDELRALAEALNAMLARRDADTEWLRRFTGDAAHELRSPVASIRAQAEVAVTHPDPALAQETLQDVAFEAQRLSELVDGLLSLARAEAGTQPAPRPVNLADAAQAAADRWTMRGVQPKVQAVTPSSAVIIEASPVEVATVLNNLIANAVRYAQALVRISVLPSDTTVRVLVDDDGPGIPEDHRERVFDRFHRVQSDRARSTGGAGLGLALVAEAVRRRGGSVRALESPESGARIEARWPLPGPLPPNRDGR